MRARVGHGGCHPEVQVCLKPMVQVVGSLLTHMHRMYLFILQVMAALSLFRSLLKAHTSTDRSNTNDRP